MRTFVAIALTASLLLACGDSQTREAGESPDVFFFDSGGAHHLEGHGAWRVTASRDGRFQAVHDVRGDETVYEEVVLEEPVRAILWGAIDTAGIDTLSGSGRAGVPDESELTFRLEMGTGETIEVKLWQNDVRDQLTLQPLLQELKMRITEVYGVEPVF